ncbi:MAG TPA: class I SAM-dependent methyltransferase [Phototrophicaceae bacterium]|jgi:ubiquinone/menaquinone biosynthesis C-methylase UbiE|nr:class I SAM-dependent methyltransferase [Phototrophicaceae bacterium]
MTDSDSRALSQQRFSQYAERYVQSSVHASGEDLQRLVDVAQPKPDDRVMDIATGGGHTARVFAPHVREVVATDLSGSMLAAARSHHQTEGLNNISYVQTDADHLAFAPNSFDIVTCRLAAHHFPDVYRFALDCYRVLKPGGRLVIEDHVMPENERAARYLDAFERLRDPSHHRMYSENEWRGTYLDVGLTVDHSEFTYKPSKLVSWAAVQDCSPYVVERLQILLAQAPDAVRDWLQPQCAGTPDASFQHALIIIVGTKPI